MATGMEGKTARKRDAARRVKERNRERNRERAACVERRVGQGRLVAHAQNLARETKKSIERNRGRQRKTGERESNEGGLERREKRGGRKKRER